MPKEEMIFELQTWQDLIKSDEWRLYLKLLEDHKDFLTKEALRCVAKGDFHNAVRAEAKVEDVDKIKDLVSARLKELRDGR